MKDKKEIIVVSFSISREKAESLSYDLSDLLCWWKGFKAGIRTIEEFSNMTSPADNGIKACQELNLILKENVK